MILLSQSEQRESRREITQGINNRQSKQQMFFFFLKEKQTFQISRITTLSKVSETVRGLLRNVDSQTKLLAPADVEA